MPLEQAWHKPTHGTSIPKNAAIGCIGFGYSNRM